MKRLALTVCVLSGLTLALGCSSEGGKSDPKLADPSKVDPRLKPAEAGGGAAPKESKSQGAIKE